MQLIGADLVELRRRYKERWRSAGRVAYRCLCILLRFRAAKPSSDPIDAGGGERDLLEREAGSFRHYRISEPQDVGEKKGNKTITGAAIVPRKEKGAQDAQQTTGPLEDGEKAKFHLPSMPMRRA